MTREQERQELYNTIWQIANDLRGSVDGWDFKAYVLGMLAYRYLSESLAGELNRGEREAEAVDFDYARQDECLEGQDRLNFVQNRGYYIEPGLLFENVMQRGEDELNIYLDKALRQIEASGEGTGAAKMFEGLFTDMDLNSNKLGATTEERNRRLKKLMQSIGGLKLGTYMEDRVGSIGRAGGAESGVDIFGDAYEYLMTMYAANAGKSGGEYFTPPEVSELLARIVTENGAKKPPRGEWRCYDPTCGSGGLLLKFLRILNYMDAITLHGQEKNVTTYNLCRVNMLLHGMNWSKLYIRNGDTLINPDPDLDERKPFDAIVSNPPYSLKWVGEDDINLVQDARFQGPGAGAIMRDEMLDILIVADMYLTGFDSQYVNTLWVDKPLKYHGLIQAFSRTNRTFGPNKPCGEIICFRNLKAAVDAAIGLFASVDGTMGILICRTYDEYYNGYVDDNGKRNDGYAKLVDTLLSKFGYQHMTQDAVGEAEQAAFVKLFGQILVSRNLLNTFDEFVGHEILTQRQFDDYKGWYLHLHDTMGKSNRDPGGSGDDVLDGLEFHIELVNEETVGIDAILERIGREAEKTKGLTGPVINADALSAIQAAVDASVSMRKKKHLLELFLAQVNNGGEYSGEAFLALVQQVYDDAIESVMKELNLRDGAREFIGRCVGAGFVLEAGAGLDAILPPVRRFGGGSHGEIRQRTIDAIQKIVNEFEGVV